MEEKVVRIINEMAEYLNVSQMKKLQEVLLKTFSEHESEKIEISNQDYLGLFLDAKKIEGCSERTIHYYRVTIERLLLNISTPIRKITTEEIRHYLVDYQKINNCSKVTVDNVRRNISSFFSWLEEEDYILKSPMRRIHKIKTKQQVKETISDEAIEQLRDKCNCLRDLALITQPSALYLIKQKLGDRVDLRFYNEKERSFHPKSYFFHYKDYSELYIGSSNISRSALTSGIEWNYRFTSTSDLKNYEKFFRTFEDLFENHSIMIDDEELKRYSKSWHRPAVSKDLDKYDSNEEDTNVRVLYEPRGAQIEALCALESTRAEGAKRALVQAATGVGKTYLAAFDSKDYEHVLFVAHREEILEQAATSFKNVRNSDDFGFFKGSLKETDKSVVFASVATLGKEEYLNEKYFVSDYFDYIVIDDERVIIRTKLEKPSKIKGLALI